MSPTFAPFATLKISEAKQVKSDTQARRRGKDGEREREIVAWKGEVGEMGECEYDLT